MQSACFAFVRKSGGIRHLSKFLQQRQISVVFTASNHDIQHQSWKWERTVPATPLIFCCKYASRTGTCTVLHQHKNLCTTVQKYLNEKETDDKETDSPPEFKPFYRLPSIIALRILSRVKIAQTCLTLAILPPLYHFHAAGLVTTLQLQFSVGVATFALFMLYAMSFYLRRVVGAMYMHRDGHIVKISHLTFWGRRQDSLVPVADVIPLNESTNKAGEILLRFERYSTNDVLYYTLRFGLLVDLVMFEDVFGKPRESERQGQSNRSKDISKD